MRISLDLDNVLFVSPGQCETEPPRRFPVNRLFPELLRMGTVDLVHTLQDQGFEVWLYTTSFRADVYIRTLFRHYGVRFDGIVNTGRHVTGGKRRSGEPLTQEKPPLSRISLHVGDAGSVPPEARTSFFQAVDVSGQDDQWTQKIIAEAARIRSLSQSA